MTGRRQHLRYVLAEPLDGHLRVREEVVIERWTGDQVEIVSVTPCRPDERLTLEVNSHGPLAVTVLDSRPFMNSDGALRHRVRLSIDPGGSAAPPGRRAL